jgi:hypothetical protein
MGVTNEPRDGHPPGRFPFPQRDAAPPLLTGSANFAACFAQIADELKHWCDKSKES